MTLPNLQRALLNAQNAIIQHEIAIHKLNAKVADIQQELSAACIQTCDPETKRQRLEKFDALLRELHQTLLNEYVATKSQLEYELDAGNSNLIDYEMEVKLDYYLSESDPGYIADSDNILATRKVFLSLDSECNALNQAQGYLTHDVVCHDYGSSPAIGKAGLLRADNVWVDFVITRQYCLSLESGAFQKMPTNKGDPQSAFM